MINERVEELTQCVMPQMDLVRHHPIYQELGDIDALRFFMEQHVFAVWDFMCLLKELQRRLVSTSAPWFPPSDPEGAQLIARIVLEEEGDLTEDGLHYQSHYQLYLQAMEGVGANTQPIQYFLQQLESGLSLSQALENAPILSSTKRFVRTTFDFFKKSTPELAAAFVYGREGLTAKMFLPWLRKIKAFPEFEDKSFQIEPLVYYLQRHIDLDQEDHFPQAKRLLSQLMDKTEEQWERVERAVRLALRVRQDFLSGVVLNLVEFSK